MPSDDVLRIRLDLPSDYGAKFGDLAWSLRTTKAALARKLVMEFCDSQSPPVQPPVAAKIERKPKSAKNS